MERCFTTMIEGLTALILLSTASLIQTAEVPHPISLTVVEVGGNVTLQCMVSKDDRFFRWYKQSLGYMVQTVATQTYNQQKLVGQFNNSRFQVTEGYNEYSLTIRNVSKEDEATYFCQNGTVYSLTLAKGTFLAVNDCNQQKSFYVKQNPETELVQSGKSVALQCAPLSKNKENTDQCPGEHSVYWFRAGSGESHPSIIYTQNRSDEREEKSCVYSLSKTIQDTSDTGTYYCAVVTCGEILFGDGAKVEIRQLDPVVFVLGALLVCCVTVIAVLIFYMNRSRVCERCKGTMRASHNPGHDKSTVDWSNDLDGEAEAVNYIALNFSTRKVKRERKKRESPPDCVYSTVRADYHTQHHPSLQAEHGLCIGSQVSSEGFSLA
ncbi:immunoglobulin kappa light chain-like [Thunnus thynnus]|uniref:immunoglobulin kappa light chain-like n=1 Tax=Thunnus thynnus TaxID=8237 RepID=UPI0035296362